MQFGCGFAKPGTTYIPTPAWMTLKMSYLVSYSESSDDDDDDDDDSHSTQLVSSTTDVDRSSEYQSVNKESPKSASYHSDAMLNGLKDTCTLREGVSEERLEAAEQRVTRSTPLTTEERFGVLQSRRKRKLDGSLSVEKESLYVPNSIQRMYEDKHRVPVDNPALHQNRVRSFPHEVGNWATHVYIQVVRDKHLVSFVKNLLELLMPQEFELLPEFHISLSRTVIIRHHWIEPLMDSLKEKLQPISTTFVCLELSEDDTELLNYVQAVDSCFKDFKLAPYYKNPSFHISVGWCLGDVVNNVSFEKLSKAKVMLSDFIAAHPDLGLVYAHQVFCRTGNKSFVVTLKES
ncbi:U6 snRNA phosphodiesterase [Elysia marginata]|uniref:U6 snRNA phosphodiesterase 1 n=1 Tax=Elysia marginata TaxID=1093978 RepID=A0AAV4FG64_9GAST|nr:U6 snRNA phosphodiesterase [Elysia marginata]